MFTAFLWWWQSIISLILLVSKWSLGVEFLFQGDTCRTRIKPRPASTQAHLHSASVSFPSYLLNQTLQFENSPLPLNFLSTLYFPACKTFSLTPNQDSKLNDFIYRNYRNRSSRKVPWWTSEKDSRLFTQAFQIQSLVGKLRSHKPHGAIKLKKKKSRYLQDTYIYFSEWY